jgi:5-deoxy-glucuronate isomerase
MATVPLAKVQPETCIIRNTAAKKGRHITVSPETTPSRHLYYGRIVLDAGDAAVKVDPGAHETGLVCLKGGATVRLGAQSFEMTPYDSLYIPRVTPFSVAPGAAGCDLAELSAPVEKAYPVQFVSFAEIQKDPGLHFTTGGENAKRTINIVLGKNIQAGRIVAGVTFSHPGHWTSWPPHEHSVMLEEAYLYIDMPAPSYGVQFVYTGAYAETGVPELTAFVREGDVIMMPQGYHPNVAIPGHQINFLWMMAANREGEDRQFGVVNVQPEFVGGGSGLEAGRAKK